MRCAVWRCFRNALHNLAHHPSVHAKFACYPDNAADAVPVLAAYLLRRMHMDVDGLAELVVERTRPYAERVGLQVTMVHTPEVVR